MARTHRIAVSPLNFVQVQTPGTFLRYACFDGDQKIHGHVDVTKKIGVILSLSMQGISIR